MSIPLPQKPKIILEEGNRAVFDIEGLYPGYGQTVGNSIRRVLLSSLEGAAITSVKIDGIGHEFTTIEGIMEDVVDIMLNLKQMRFRIHGEGPFTVQCNAKGEGEVTGGDFKTPSQVEVVSKDLHIATLSSKKSVFSIEAVVEAGRGYVPVEARTKDKVEVGIIALDAAFSPVRMVNYEVENMRLGDRTDYNRVRFHIETDGSITPRDAFTKATKILVDQFSALTEGFSEFERPHAVSSSDAVESADIEETESDDSVAKLKLDDLKLSSRTLNALREAGIKTVGGLMRKKEDTLQEIDGMGEKGMQEIKKAMGNFGITLKQ